MRYYILIMSTLMLSACVQTDVEKELSSLTPSASTICSGTTILNVAGTADCSGAGELSPSTGPIAMLSFASRKDNASFPDPSTFPLSIVDFDAFFADRTSATLAQELAGGTSFSTKHSLVPNPLYDSDGRYEVKDWNGNSFPSSVPEKRHYLETIARNDPDISSRAGILACGASGTIEARIADCATINGLWSFYDGKKYGQDGEGDWKLVSVLGAGPKFEVWRDERTKLLWSDKSTNEYNWYQAAGYSKPDAISKTETEFLSSPGTAIPEYLPDHTFIMQPASPVSVCIDADVLNHGEGTSGYTYVGPPGETGNDTTGYSFKGNIISTQATWRLPTRSDWLLAEVNGIRKVLPNMDYSFWSATTFSHHRNKVWTFLKVESLGMGEYQRFITGAYVRCVASSRD
jgi:hypothetical protein